MCNECNKRVTKASYRLRNGYLVISTFSLVSLFFSEYFSSVIEGYAYLTMIILVFFFYIRVLIFLQRRLYSKQHSDYKGKKL